MPLRHRPRGGDRIAAPYPATSGRVRVSSQTAQPRGDDATGLHRTAERGRAGDRVEVAGRQVVEQGQGLRGAVERPQAGGRAPLVDDGDDPGPGRGAEAGPADDVPGPPAAGWVGGEDRDPG